MTDPFLIDECLSPDLAALAHARGYNATHVVYRGLQGSADADLMPIIRAESFILVTNNGRDFLRLYAGEDVHPGLVIIVPGGIGAEMQVKLFGRALDTVEDHPDLTNKVVQVFLDEAVEVKDWPTLGG